MSTEPVTVVARRALDDRGDGAVRLGAGRAHGKAILLGEHAVVYGAPALAVPVPQLTAVAKARRAGLTDVTLQGNFVKFTPVALPDSKQVRLQRLYPKSILKPATDTLLVPAPKTAPLGGRPLRAQELLTWATDLVEALFLETATASGKR